MKLSQRDIVVCLLIGLATGLMSGLMGVGGGIVMVPLMTALLGVSQHKAHGTSLAVIVFTAISGALTYLWQAHLKGANLLGSMSLATYLLIAVELTAGSMVGARIGALLMNRIPARELRMLFGVFLFFAALRLLLPLPTSSGTFTGTSPAAVAGVVLIGLVAGILSGIMGVGGGVVMVPAMVLLLGMIQQPAQGISLLVIIPTAIVGAQTHLYKGNVVTSIVPWIALTAIVTAIAGSLLANMLPAKTLTQVFGVFLVVVSIQMTVTAWRQKPKVAH